MTRFRARNMFLEMGDGASDENYARVAQVIDYDGPGHTTEFETFDDHDVPLGFVEKIPVSKDAGGLSFNIHWDPANPTHIALEDEYEQGWEVPVNWRFNAPTPQHERRTKAFKAWVADLGPIQAAAAGKLTRSIRLELTGKPNMAAGAAS